MDHNSLKGRGAHATKVYLATRALTQPSNTRHGMARITSETPHCNPVHQPYPACLTEPQPRREVGPIDPLDVVGDAPIIFRFP